MKIFFGKLTYHPDFVINYKVLRDKVAIEENMWKENLNSTKSPLRTINRISQKRAHYLCVVQYFTVSPSKMNQNRSDTV